MDPATTLSDARRTYRFWVDDCIIDTYGNTLGPHGIAIYTALARHAKRGTAFPALDTLATETGMSRCSAKRALHLLVELGLIIKEPRQRPDGGQTSNLYTLVDLSAYHAPSTPTTMPPAPIDPPASIPQTPPPAPIDPPPGSDRPPKDSLLKDTQEEGISVCIPVPQPPDTDTPPVATLTGKTPGTRQPFPAFALAQEQLKTALFTPDLHQWASVHARALDLDREFARWLCHGISRGRWSADFPADFRAWLLDPLTTRAQMSSSAHAGTTPAGGRPAPVAGVAPVAPVAGVAPVAPVAREEEARDEQAAQEALTKLGDILGANWRERAPVAQPRRPYSVIREES